jgi:hypothetical protein
MPAARLTIAAHRAATIGARTDERLAVAMTRENLTKVEVRESSRDAREKGGGGTLMRASEAHCHHAPTAPLCHTRAHSTLLDASRYCVRVHSHRCVEIARVDRAVRAREERRGASRLTQLRQSIYYAHVDFISLYMCASHSTHALVMSLHRSKLMPRTRAALRIHSVRAHVRRDVLNVSDVILRIRVCI